MVILGFYFIAFFILILFFIYKKKLEEHKWLMWLAIITMPLAYIASEAGWIVTEVGRQPWVIQDMMPTVAAVSQIDSSAVIVTFILFAVVFTALLIAEIKIMARQIKIGPKDGGTN
jgi:cytochrome d ubiquinol oxidase subunit I